MKAGSDDVAPARPRGRILVVDDHVAMARLLADQLGDAGYEVQLAQSGEAALALLREDLPDAVISDLRMEKVDGFDVLEGIRAIDPTLPVLIMTAFGAIETAVEAIKRGAYHYLTKPFRLEEVLLYVERALSDRRLRDENRALRKVAIERTSFHAMVGGSAAMQDLYDVVERVAQSQAPVLIRGDSGAGKELVARALHFQGPRKDHPFVAVNCTALPEPLLESELFGHVRGAFTGATSARRGLFVEASGGTLFLDEIGDMPAGLQAKLLRTLEDGAVRAVGSDVPRQVDVRIVAATHQDLEALSASGRFRSDLYFRLNVVPLRVPPLSQRPEDIALLVDHFLRAARLRDPGLPAQRFSPALVAALARRAWPGNVRELKNLVERLLIVSPKEVVDVDDLERFAPAPAGAASPIDAARDKMPTLRRLEKDYIAWVIERCEGNKTRAAEILGIDVSTIHRREKG